ncbi:MAG: ABC transporter permease [Chloroflexi bacterium]|nr:ABC transporter permease [Chloroflexota bacterium]MCL5076480.1 ABC transporter permease [Chloroflexota bacterium]
MTSYILRRLLEFVPVVLMIVLINFLIIHTAPGDPAVIMAGEDAKLDYIVAVRQKYGLDQPLTVQLWRYLSCLAEGDLGRSLSHDRPVAELILSRLPATILLVLSSQIGAIVVGIVLGTYAAQRYGSNVDRFLTALSSAVYSVPVFWLGLLLILLFGLRLHWVPTSGMVSIGQTYKGFAYVMDVLHHLIMPLTTLILAYWPPYYRVTRTSAIDVLHEEYVAVARSKGLSERQVFYRHVLRNAIIPTTSLAGLQLGFVVAGTVLVETVFGWPGMGTLMYNGILSRDYPILMGVYVVVSISVLLASLLTDLAYLWLDPRVSYR